MHRTRPELGFRPRSQPIRRKVHVPSKPKSVPKPNSRVGCLFSCNFDGKIFFGVVVGKADDGDLRLWYVTASMNSTTGLYPIQSFSDAKDGCEFTAPARPDGTTPKLTFARDKVLLRAKSGRQISLQDLDPKNHRDIFVWDPKGLARRELIRRMENRKSGSQANRFKDMRRMGKNDPAHTYNDKLAESIKKLTKPIPECKFFTLDTRDRLTIKAVQKCGILPQNTHSPNHCDIECLHLAESKSCQTACMDYMVYLDQHKDIRFDAFFLDNGGTVDGEAEAKDNSIAQHKQIKQIFEKGKLADECVFAVVTSHKMMEDGEVDEYNIKAQQFVKSVAQKHGYGLVSAVDPMPCTRRSFYQCYHFKKV